MKTIQIPAVTAFDVSEMNFGGQLSFQEYRNKWNQTNESEWNRTLNCGATKKYDQLGRQKNGALSVEQIRSPDAAASQAISGGRRDGTVLEKVRGALNQFIPFTGREL